MIPSQGWWASSGRPAFRYDIRPESLGSSKRNADTNPIKPKSGEDRNGVGRMRRSLSASGVLERGRGMAAIAASAALIGGSVFGVAGASGHGDHGRGGNDAPGFQTGQQLGQAGVNLAHDDGNSGWHGDGNSSGGWSGPDGRHGDAPSQPVSYQAAAPALAARPAPAPPPPPAAVQADNQGGPPPWAGHGPQQDAGRPQGDGGAGWGDHASPGPPPWAGQGHGPNSDQQGNQDQSASSAASGPAHTSQRQNVAASQATATPAATSSPAVSPAPAPAPAPAPVPAPAATPSPTVTTVAIPVTTSPGPGKKKTSALPSFDSSTSLLGSLDSLPSTVIASRALGLRAAIPALRGLASSGTIGALSGALPAANAALGAGSAIGANGATGATGAVAGGQASARSAAHHHGNQSGSVAPIIEFMPNVIDHFVNVVPGIVWLALAASVGIGLAGVGSAVAFRRKANRQAGRFAAVAAAALTDPLTGVLNRRGFSEAVERELARARRYGRPFVLAYVDVRGLKAVNDTEGHLAGDELLKGVAGLLGDSARADDVVGRLGGDELGLLLAEQTPETAGAVIQRIEEQVAQRRAALGLSAPWSLTIGTAAYPDDGNDFDDLIRTADRRLYEQRGIELR
jgi:diguanylate cyclase (GGDEF)-like protein